MEKVDPRIIRTRKLIMDAFVRLSKRMEYKDIKIKDITTEATINRATFYAHFIDKDDLLEEVLVEDLMVHVLDEIKKHEIITAHTIRHLFFSLVEFRGTLQETCEKCYSSFEQKMELIMHRELISLFEGLLLNENNSLTKEHTRIKAVMLTGAITGAVKDYKRCCKLEKEEYINIVLNCLVNPIIKPANQSID